MAPNEAGVLESTSAAFFPQEISFARDDIQRERLNSNITLQFAATDRLTYTLDHTTSKATTGNNSLSWGVWNGSFGGNANSYELDENGTAIYYNSSGDDGSYTAFRETTEVDSSATGFNIDYDYSDTLNFEFDMHRSKTTTDNGLDSGMNAQGRVILGSAALSTKEYFFRDGDIPGFALIGITVLRLLTQVKLVLTSQYSPVHLVNQKLPNTNLKVNGYLILVMV